MINKVLLPAGAAGLLIALAATNPDERAHTRAMVEHVRKSCGDNRLVKGMCGGLTSLAAGMAMGYDDHLLYSTARMGDVETLGILGRVTVIGE